VFEVSGERSEEPAFFLRAHKNSRFLHFVQDRLFAGAQDDNFFGGRKSSRTSKVRDIGLFAWTICNPANAFATTSLLASLLA